MIVVLAIILTPQKTKLWIGLTSGYNDGLVHCSSYLYRLRGKRVEWKREFHQLGKFWALLELNCGSACFDLLFYSFISFFGDQTHDGSIFNSDHWYRKRVYRVFVSFVNAFLWASVAFWWAEAFCYLFFVRWIHFNGQSWDDYHFGSTYCNFE